jgi:hypothetical protein
MTTKQPTRPKMNDRLAVAMSPDEKRRLFETAAARNTTVSQMIRSALASIAAGEQRAA